MLKALPAQACTNDSGGVITHVISFDPRKIPDFLYSAHWDTEYISQVADIVTFSNRNWAEVLRRLTEAGQTYAQGSSLDNAKAIALMRLGRANEAVNLLIVSEHQTPGRYDTAANLGTAYELAGNLAKAKEWISEAISRNPKSHSGTEWLHVRILEVRMALERDPEYLDTHSVSDLEFGTAALPKAKGNPDKERMLRALQYQLRERISFVPPPDPVVGDMLFDLANLLCEEKADVRALAHYRLARMYAPEMKRPLNSRLAFIENSFKEEELKRQNLEADRLTKKVSENYIIKYADMRSLREDLMRLVPTAAYRFSVDRRWVMVKGTEDEHRQVRSLLEILDQHDE